MRKIIEYLEENARNFPDKKAYFDEESSLSWKEVRDLSFRLATALIRRLGNNEKEEIIAIQMRKSPYAVVAFLGVLLAGRAYSFLDMGLPKKRLNSIFKLLNPSFIIDEENVSLLLEEEMEEGWIRKQCEKNNKNSLLYVSFTSSTTGEPKGVETEFGAVSNYVSGLIQCLGFQEESVIANQSPFHFDAYLKDVYAGLFIGGSVYLIPRELFLKPMKLAERLEKHRVNTLTWTASAYSILAGYETQFSKKFIEGLHLLTFGSEVMSPKVLNYLRKEFPKTKMIQLYGTTETTGMTMYYEVKRDFSKEEKIPLGSCFPGTEIKLLEEEIVIFGEGLARGYRKNSQKTREVFREVEGKRGYFTGDLGEYNQEGDLFYKGRKNRVIKRAGYRLSLDDLEVLVKEKDEIREVAALFEEEKGKILLFYEGEVETSEIRAMLRELFPKEVLPSKVQRVDKIPKLANGKKDYRGLRDGKTN